MVGAIAKASTLAEFCEAPRCSDPRRFTGTAWRRYGGGRGHRSALSRSPSHSVRQSTKRPVAQTFAFNHCFFLAFRNRAKQPSVLHASNSGPRIDAILHPDWHRDGANPSSLPFKVYQDPTTFPLLNGLQRRVPPTPCALERTRPAAPESHNLAFPSRTNDPVPPGVTLPVPVSASFPAVFLPA